MRESVRRLHLDLSMRMQTALIEGARLFSHATDGVMPWRGRPEALKRGLIARTPPIDFPGDA